MMRNVILKVYISENQLAEESHCVLGTVVHLGPEGTELCDTQRFSLNSALCIQKSLCRVFLHFPHLSVLVPVATASGAQLVPPPPGSSWS